ncbi:MAG: hypothetical protein L6R41_003891 [Letrouitia leprolyta]|nr:MAG: hypothetical protein L6R41_003891 [Letrouitia leprolyta]
MAPTEYSQGLLRVGGLWALLFAVPLCLSAGWYILTHWGWWKLHDRRTRSPLVRTWHGWVDSGKCKDKSERNRLKKSPPSILPRTTRADYSWVFWDPTGEKQEKFRQQREETMVRYLPRWMRSNPFGSVAPTVGDIHDLEAARGSDTIASDGTSSSTGYLTILGRQWRRRWRKTRTTWSDTTNTYRDSSDHRFSDNSDQQRNPSYVSATNSHPSINAESTVRMRKTNQRGPTRDNESVDIARAMTNQLLAPTAGARLVCLFQKSSIPRPETEGMIQAGLLERGEGCCSATARDDDHRQPVYPYPYSGSPTMLTGNVSLPLAVSQQSHHCTTYLCRRSITVGNTSLPRCSDGIDNRPAGLRQAENIECYRKKERRVRTWAARVHPSCTEIVDSYGVEDSSPHDVENIRPTSMKSPVLETEPVDVESTINSHPGILISKKRKEGRGTDDSIVEAETMSMVDVNVPGFRYLCEEVDDDGGGCREDGGAGGRNRASSLQR